VPKGDGRGPDRLGRIVFVRLLGAVYFFAFWSVVQEAEALLGRYGLTPVGRHYKRLHVEGGGVCAPASHHSLPRRSGVVAAAARDRVDKVHSRSARHDCLFTALARRSSDAMLRLCGYLGLAGSVTVVHGAGARLPVLLVLWILYGSFVHVRGAHLSGGTRRRAHERAPCVTGRPALVRGWLGAAAH
jgi:hypothetical protein